MDRIFYWQATAGADGKTGLTVAGAVKRWRISRSTGVAEALADGNAVEIGYGFYFYRWADVDPATYDYLAVFVTADTTVTLKAIGSLWSEYSPRAELALPNVIRIAAGTDPSGALQAATAGSIVALDAGVFDIASAITIADGVTIRGAGKNLTTIRGAGLTDSAAALVTIGSNVTLEDLSVLSNSDFAESCPVAVMATDTMGVRLRRCSMTGADNGFAGTDVIGFYFAMPEGGSDAQAIDCSFGGYGAGAGKTNYGAKADDAGALTLTTCTASSTVAVSNALLCDCRTFGTTPGCTVSDSIGAKTAADAAKASADTAATNATTAGTKADAAKESADTAVTQTTQTAIQAALTAQGVTEARAGNLDNLDAKVSDIPTVEEISAAVRILPLAATVTQARYTTTAGAIINLEMAQNEEGEWAYAIVDGNGDAVSMTGHTVQFNAHYVDGSVVFKCDSDSDGVTIADNVVTVVVSTTKSATARNVDYKLWDLTDSKLLASGQLRIKYAPVYATPAP